MKTKVNLTKSINLSSEASKLCKDIREKAVECCCKISDQNCRKKQQIISKICTETVKFTIKFH